MSHAEPVAPAAGGTARASWRSHHVVEWTAVIVALALRLPFVAIPAGPDEAGFLQVAGQWSPGGGSLYGSYWVDRPPLLITLFQIADSTGGLVALRLIGCVAVAATIVLSARAAGIVAGPRASAWTAITTAALLVAPGLGTQEISGELLAAPFVAGGLLALVQAERARDPRWPSFVGGVAGTCAVLVKQNLVDVAVFATVLVVAMRWFGRRDRSARPQVRIGYLVAGVVTTVVIASVWVLARGTSPLDVFHAMYAFRVQAARTISEGGGLAHARPRAALLAWAWVSSGLALLTVAVAVTAPRWRRSPVMVALAATIAFDAVSVAAGGAYWFHYLIQMIVPLAVAIGVLAARTSRVATGAALTAFVLAGAPAVLQVSDVPSSSTGEQIGTAIAASSRPGDTLTTLYGQPQVNLAAGLASPYPHLWSLPVKTLDPRLTELDSLLAGPDAPTWLLVTDRIRSWGLDTSRTRRLIAARYHRVARHNGHTIFLLDGVRRPPPVIGGAETAPRRDGKQKTP
ncbi:ArnT family glycosyltransferase [Aeromicrobium wangtongii]|uniref:Glycosyltransferase RgtA/B/C/D-like domain-containing protein n=1 Tax=Aeromicrobium wangtongii TaxID=2969247 RepID=A0ABY5M9P2_9ACTN|nr:hypothetical protein [Aeromicrobium wangtongii]MCD9197360.1 hypothetical protein [Aeromicrobium wangtongii]UUP14854.1 hypothetical protein NQV15_05960 [Aeromicrobium wangtongii]